MTVAHLVFPERLTCPVCGQHLSRLESMLRCPQGHSFDRAKQGYFNLLQNCDKKSSVPGDSLEMVQARKAFLDAGYYAPLVQACQEIIRETFDSPSTGYLNYTDIACGEGYYTQAFAQTLCVSNDSVSTTGLDISSPAIRHAAKRLDNTAWLVANAFRLPIASDSQQLITHLFCRPCPSEASRVMAAGGKLIDVSAGSEHLKSLRKALYGEISQKPEKGKASPYLPRLKQLRTEELRFNIELSRQPLSDLIAMTPHGWRANPGRVEDVVNGDAISIECHFLITLFAKERTENPCYS